MWVIFGWRNEGRGDGERLQLCVGGCLDRERPQLYVGMSRLGVGLQGVKFFSCLVGLVNLFFGN